MTTIEVERGRRRVGSCWSRKRAATKKLTEARQGRPRAFFRDSVSTLEHHHIPCRPPPPLLPLLPRASSPGDAAEGVSGSFVLFSQRRHCVCHHSASSTSHPALRILCRGEQRARRCLSPLPRSLGCLALRTSCRARITVPFFEFLSLCRCQRMVVSLPQWLCSCVSSLPNTRASRDAASTRTPRQKPRWCTGTPRGKGSGRVRCFSLLPSSPALSLYIGFFLLCACVPLPFIAAPPLRLLT